MKQTGGFGRIQDYEKIKEAGFDYAELDIPEIEALSENEFDLLMERVHKTGFPILTGARVLPITEPWFFTDGYDPEQWMEYLRRACSRCVWLGMKKLIIGNGKARLLPADADEETEERFIKFLRAFCRIAGAHGLEVILEPLGPKYSNYINTLPQAVEVIGRVGEPNLYTMADMRHMVGSREPFEDLADCSAYLHHIHIDYPLPYPARPFPTMEDDYDYGPFFRALEKSGYDGTLTIEADFPRNWDSAYRRSEPLLRQYWMSGKN